MHRFGVGAEAMSVASRMRATAHKPTTKARVAVLGALVATREEHSEFCFQDFNYLARRTHLPRRLVRVAARKLTRDGLAVYGNGLWGEDDKPAGAGYAATALGAIVHGIIAPE